MSVNKYLVSALMASGMAMAASTDACSGTIQISSQSDADALDSCKTVSGDIAIQSSAANQITFNGVEKVTGSFTADGAVNVTAIAAPLLTSIGKDFTLKDVNSLTSLNFPELTSVGSLNFEALANLQGLGFTKGVTSAGTVSIVNTGLTSLSGIELDQVGDFDLTANNFLTDINVNNIKNITGLLTISNNNNKLTIDFPNLVTAQNMTFRNTSTISVPSLANLTGQLGLFGTYVSNFSAPNLTSCGDLGFDSNGQLSEISLPLLKTLTGGLSISNNGKLDTIDFPKLATVDGAIDVTGSFSNLTLPSLELVQGGFNAQSTSDFSCDTFKTDSTNQIIRGNFSCHTTAHPTTMDGSSGSNSTSSSSSSASSSSGAAVNNVVAPSMGFTAVIGALLSLLM